MSGQLVAYRLSTLGGFKLVGPEGPLDVRGTKLRALLAYLASNSGAPQPREHLTSLLWGSHFEAQARQNLRAMLTRIRGITGGEALTSDQATIALRPDIIACDTEKLEDCVRCAALTSLREALELYRGDFLEGVQVPEAAWEDWLRAERQRFKALAIEAGMRLGERELEGGEPAAALRAGIRVTEIDEFREDAHRLVMRSLVQLERQAEAIRHYDMLRHRLREELGVAPSSETIGLGDSIRETTRNATAAVTARPRDPLGPRKPTIAVLPFVNKSGDTAQDLFCDGVTEDIITELSRFRDLYVTDRGSSFAFKGQSSEIDRIGAQLGVQYVLEGSVRRYAKRVRITVQLADAQSGTQIWGDRYDRKFEDIFAVQDEVVRTIAAHLVGWLERRGRERARQRPTTSLEAYELVIEGRAHFFRMLPEENRKARRLFEKAVALDANYAAAQVWLAETHLGDWAGGWPPSPRDSLALGLDCATKAVWLDETDSRTHATLARAYYWHLEFEKARHHFDRALTLNPSDTWALASSARCFILEGHPAKGLRQLLEAVRLNPLGSYGYQLGIAHYAMRQYDEAVRALGAVRDPINLVYAWQAAGLARTGSIQEAKRAAANFKTAFRSRNERIGVTKPHSAKSFLVERYPFRLEQDLEHFLDGLRLAGIDV